MAPACLSLPPSSPNWASVLPASDFNKLDGIPGNGRGEPQLFLNLTIFASEEIVLSSWKYFRPVVSSTVLLNPSYGVKVTDV